MRALVAMTLEEIISNWDPGDRDWSWYEEVAFLHKEHEERLSGIREAVRAHGISFADHKSPIKLGNHGRVLNGHHRLVVAMENPPACIMVDVVGPEEDNHG